MSRECHYHKQQPTPDTKKGRHVNFARGSLHSYFDACQKNKIHMNCFANTGLDWKCKYFSRLMRLWHLHVSPSVNSIFKHACAAIHWRYTSDFWSEPFVYFHTLCVRTAKALATLRKCAFSPEPSLFAYAISTIMS